MRGGESVIGHPPGGVAVLPGCSCGRVECLGLFPMRHRHASCEGSSDRASGPARRGTARGGPQPRWWAGSPVVSAQLQNVCPLPINSWEAVAKEVKEKADKTRDPEAVVDDGLASPAPVGESSALDSVDGWGPCLRRAEGALHPAGSPGSDVAQLTSQLHGEDGGPDPSGTPSLAMMADTCDLMVACSGSAGDLLKLVRASLRVPGPPAHGRTG